MRIPLIAGNWKMHKDVRGARDLVVEIEALVKENEKVQVVVCPPTTALYALKEELTNASLKLGAQNMYFQEEGAYTGEVSPLMLKDVGCSHVILGHSERRAIFKEKDEDIREKVQAAFKHELIPILCVGETLEERKKGQTEKVVETQLKLALEGLEANKDLVIAYEPVWAIGTGESASSEEANRVIHGIRVFLEGLWGPVASEMRILYGGSVKPNTIQELMAQEDIDGALVGGASLDAKSFAGIVNFHAP